METAIAILIIFAALIFFHELGHFYVAKRVGILTREFAIGFGPKIFSFKKGETRYTLRLLPLGGFVRMAGEDPEMVVLKAGQKVNLAINAEDQVERIVFSTQSAASGETVIDFDLEKDLYLTVEDWEGRTHRYDVSPTAMLVHDDQETQIAPLDRQFSYKTKGQRAAVIVAGPLMNFILAFVVFAAASLITGVPVNDPMIGDIEAGSPAAAAGLMKGDKVIAINGQAVHDWMGMVKLIQSSPGQRLDMVMERNGQKIVKSVIPDNVNGQGRLGIYQPKTNSFTGSIAQGFTQTWSITAAIFTALGDLITGKVSAGGLAGPVGIVSATNQVAQEGFGMLLVWAGFLSINLGVFNLLPIPALDGSRLFFIGIEALRGKPIDPRKESMVHFIGFAFLMLLMVVVTYNDISKLFS